MAKRMGPILPPAERYGEVVADLAPVYDETRQRITATVSELDDATLQRAVPAAPDWMVRDLVAHLTGDLAAVLADDLPASFFANFGDPAEVAKLNAWTDRMVTERRTRPSADVLAEWEMLTPKAWAVLGARANDAGLGSIADGIVATDAAVHEQDLYGALGVAQARDSAALRVGTTSYVNLLGLRLNGLAPVQFETESKTYAAGAGEPSMTARVERFELFRALSGRRSPDQIRAWDWTGDPDPYLELFYLYGPRTEPVVEP
jgi:uncharacterized protein (TIGR03083 family)